MNKGIELIDAQIKQIEADRTRATIEYNKTMEMLEITRSMLNSIKYELEESEERGEDDD